MSKAPLGLSYALALLLGAASVIWLLPLSDLLPSRPLDTVFDGDNAQSVIGQRYFLGEGWTWPPFRASRLDWPAGLSVAFTDSIPLLLLPLKLFRALLPAGFYVQDGWIALAWTLQPAAAVFALRGAGERRLGPALAVAAMSISMPSLLARFPQKSLCTHAILLLALGLHFRLVRDARPRDGAAAVGLLFAALLVHPYLLVMAAAVLAAAPLSLALRRDRRCLPCAAWVLAGIGAAGGMGVLFGYGGSALAPGYGVYSMNALGPVLPGPRGAWPLSIPDPTTGQAFEGYQYLGGGVILVGVAALAALRRGGAAVLRRHAGLFAALLALTLASLSGTVYLGGHRLTHVTHVPQAIEQFRATGRFFWPAAYAILVGGAAAVMRAWPPRAATLLLGAAAALRWVDAGPLRQDVRIIAGRTLPWSIDAASLAPVLARHDLLTIWPTDGCGASAGGSQAFMHLLLLGSRTLIRTNTMYSARQDPGRSCDPEEVLGRSWQPHELRAILPPGKSAERGFIPGADRLCWQARDMILCSQDVPDDAERPVDAPSAAPLGETLRHGSAPFQSLLGRGWGVDEADGVWSASSDATLRFALPPGSGEVRVVMEAYAIAPAPGGTQTVRVLADGLPVAEWRLADLTPAMLEALAPAGATELRLVIERPTRPKDRGMGPDPRRLGFHLVSIRFDPA